MNLSPFDLAIIGLYLLFIFYSGSIVKRFVKNIDDFLLAGRSMGLHLGLASLVSSEIGIITFMYLAEAGYRSGLVALTIGLPFFIVLLFLGKTGFIIKPLMDMKIATVPELFQKTYGPGVRLACGLFMAVGGLLNFGVFPRVEAQFINALTGIPQKYLLTTMLVLLTIVLIYTVLGGMVSVILTNYIQFILLALGMIFITVLGLTKIGWGPLVATVQSEFGRSGVDPFAPGSSFGWTFVLWQLLFQLSVLTIAPYIAMRIFSSKDTRTGRRILTRSSILFFGRAVIPVFWGILALTYFASAKPADPLQALPLMIGRLVPKGILGIVFVSFLAASMSTYSSYLLSWSSVISQDIIGVAWERLTGRKVPERTQMLITRLTMAGIILFLIWWSFFFRSGELLFFYLMMAVNIFLAGTLVSAVFGIYLRKESLGLLRARPLGAYLAFGLGAFPTVWFFLPAHPPVSQLGAWSYVFALGGMVVGSVINNLVRPLRTEEAGR